VRTVRNVKAAGLSTCCGGIIGMGGTDDDVVDLALALRELGVDSLPVNFYTRSTARLSRRELSSTPCVR